MMGAERRSHGHERRREEAHRLSRGRPRDRRPIVPDHDPVYKVTIIPRGRALGVTMFLPEEDRYSYSKQRLESRMTSLFGGRLAEELVFGPDVRHDGRLERHRARHRHRAQHGHEVGPVGSTRPAHLHRGRRRECSSAAASRVTSRSPTSLRTRSTRKCARSSTRYAAAKRILETNREKLDMMAAALMKYETIDEEQIKDIMEGREPKPPADWDEPSEPGKLVQRESAGQRRRSARRTGRPALTASCSGLTIVSGHAPALAPVANRMRSRADPGGGSRCRGATSAPTAFAAGSARTR